MRKLSHHAVILVVLAVAVIVLAGCDPVVFDENTFAGVPSEARYQVVPTTVSVGGQATDAIDVQLQYCNQFHVDNWTNDFPVEQDQALMPIVTVKDANLKTIFDNTFPGPEGVTPAGSQVVTSPMGSTELSHVIVPVAGAADPLTIYVQCASSQYGPNEVITGYGFTNPCVTSDRTCGWSGDGSAFLDVY